MTSVDINDVGVSPFCPERGFAVPPTKFSYITLAHAARLTRIADDACPDVEFIPAYSEFTCDQMKMITVERLLKCLETERFEITVPEEVADKARTAIERMLEVS